MPPEHAGLSGGAQVTLAREMSKPHLGPEPSQQAIKMGSGRGFCWFLLWEMLTRSRLLLCKCRLQAASSGQQFFLCVSTTYLNSLASKDHSHSPRPCSASGDWYCWRGSCFLTCFSWALDHVSYALKVWAYEPLGMTLQIALFVTWNCDNCLWHPASIVPTLHTFVLALVPAWPFYPVCLWYPGRQNYSFPLKHHIFNQIFENM